MKRGHIALVWLAMVLSGLAFGFGLVAFVITLNRGDEQIKAARERKETDEKLTQALDRQTDVWKILMGVK